MVRAPYAGGAEGVCGHLKADGYANSDLTVGYENLVLFAQAGVAKNSIFAKTQPDLLRVFAEHFCFEKREFKKCSLVKYVILCTLLISK